MHFCVIPFNRSFGRIFVLIRLHKFSGKVPVRGTLFIIGEGAMLK